MALSEKTRRRIKISLILIPVIIVLLASLLFCANTIARNSNENFISKISKVEYDNQLVPYLDTETGYYTFTTDSEFKILQITDFHITASVTSWAKDRMAFNAVAAMISYEKPDLVLITGDLTFSVPYELTGDNKKPAVLIAEFMEQLGVYWAANLGNHDSESYMYYSRDKIADVYENREKYPHSLFMSGPEDVYGYGNYIINIENTSGEITQSLVLMDTNNLLKDSKLINGDYDCIHADQVKWYENEMYRLKEINNGIMPNSLMYIHMPPQEMSTACELYLSGSTSSNIEYLYGENKEEGGKVYPSTENYGLFDKVLEVGSTKGIFFGHDHLNNIHIKYKGIELGYGMSIDYIAYFGIKNYGKQRGCTVMNVYSDGSFVTHQENYYQDKYVPIQTKETVKMVDMKG